MKIRNMERGISSFMSWFLLWAILAFDFMLKVSGNPEGDALYALKNNLADPNNVLQNWDPTEVNHCMWFRVRCNSDNSVIRIDLGGENLSGELVPQLGQLSNLQHLLLYSNNISGKIPYEFGKLTNLVSLDLYMNRLTGPIPATLGNLKKLRFLRLNNNSLSENIPMSLTTVASLQVLDLSNNQLEGDIPVNGSFSLFTSTSFGNNPGLKQRKFSPPPLICRMPSAPSGNSATAAIASGVAVGIALSFAVPAIALAYLRRRKREDHDRYFDVPAENPDKIQDQVKQFSLLDLQIATSNFSNKNIVGEGGYGKVYKGRLSDGSLVVVKRLDQSSFQGEEEYQRELLMIYRAVHRNLLRLHGFCVTPNERIIVYPFMVNGSVESHLRGRPESQPPLDWPTRKRITLGVARGLAYLHEHCDPKIIHRDVKAANILLDEEFEAVVGDFGSSKHMDYKDTHATTRILGTFGYAAPEYVVTGKISEKADVFGYGVMLLELITGERAIDRAQLANDKDRYLLDRVKRQFKDKGWKTLVDVDLQGNYDEEEAKHLIQVALLCTQDSPTRRPKMSEVVRMLEDYDLAEYWEQWENEGMSHQDLCYTDHLDGNWIVDYP